MNITSFAIETIQIYGVTRDPKTEEYAIVMEFQNDGNLRDMIKKNHVSLNWEVIIRMLWKISYGLHCIHDENYHHKDLHSGNILYDHVTPVISDFGLCCPLDQNSTDELYGVLPFFAPEIIRRKEFTAAADIYGFGMLILEIISGEAPFASRDHDVNLALDICLGKRPQIPEYTPKPYATLMERCWDADPSIRPTAWKLREQFLDWLNIISSFDNPEVELATKQEIEEEFNQKRENKWKERLAEVIANPQPVKTSQNLFVSKRLDYISSMKFLF
jgi:serine/threonine protein kinase